MQVQGTYNWLFICSYSPLAKPLSRVNPIIIGLSVDLEPTYKYPGPPSRYKKIAQAPELDSQPHPWCGAGVSQEVVEVLPMLPCALLNARLPFWVAVKELQINDTSRDTIQKMGF